MSSDFRLGIKSLLQLATPPHGVAVLLYRHPFGNIYYPLEIHVSDELGYAQVHPLRSYFLFSMRLDGSECEREREIDIPAGASADVLLQHGKLAVHLFEKSDLRIRFHAYEYDTDRDIVLAIIDPKTSAAKPPSSTLLRATVHFARGWVKVNERLLIPDGNTADEILDSVRRILDDQNPDPPFFPVLHTHVADKRPKAGTVSRHLEACGSNSLSYNCALWSRCDTLRAAYIDEMFIRAENGERCFKHTIKDDSDILVKAVTEVCDDWVHRMATSASGAILCARFNVPKTLALAAQEQMASLGHQLAPDDSDWKLVKRGINRLLTPDEFSALVTMWVGRVENGKVLYAMPLGFMPGMRSHYLADIAEVYSRLAEKEPLASTNGRVGISTVRVDGLADKAWPKTESIIISLANETAARIESLEAGFPPPFTFDFGCQPKVAGDSSMGDLPLIIRCGSPSTEPILISSSDRAYLMFVLFAKAKESNSVVTHEELKQLVFEDDSLTAKKVFNRLSETWKKYFTARGFTPPGKNFIANVRGRGWKFGKDVEVRRLNADMLRRAFVQFKDSLKIRGSRSVEKRSQEQE